MSVLELFHCIYQSAMHIAIHSYVTYTACVPPLQWEQKCLELVAERQMAFEIATVPR